MNPILAQDLAPKLPAAATSDPIVWIASILVLTVVGLLWWQMKAAKQERDDDRAERSADRENRDKSLSGFFAEMAAARGVYVEQLRVRDKFEDERDTRLNNRIDGTHEKLDNLVSAFERSH